MCQVLRVEVGATFLGEIVARFMAEIIGCQLTTGTVQGSILCCYKLRLQWPGQRVMMYIVPERWLTPSVGIIRSSLCTNLVRAMVAALMRVTQICVVAISHFQGTVSAQIRSIRSDPIMQIDMHYR